MDPDSSPRRPSTRVGRRLEVDVTDARGRTISDGGLARWLRSIAPPAARGAVAIAIVPDERIRKLNREYRSVDRITDVLSFPADDGTVLGDIVIARGVARRQARERGHAFQTELRVLALHGLLHLVGYDHDDVKDGGRMRRAEERLRRRGGLRTGLIARGPASSTASPASRAKR